MTQIQTPGWSPGEGTAAGTVPMGSSDQWPRDPRSGLGADSTGRDRRSNQLCSASTAEPLTTAPGWQRPGAHGRTGRRTREVRSTSRSSITRLVSSETDASYRWGARHGTRAKDAAEADTGR